MKEPHSSVLNGTGKGLKQLTECISMDAIWSKHAHLVLEEELGLCWELSSSSRLEQDILLELLLESLMVLLKSLLECL
jgi:hypothetical protein